MDQRGAVHQWGPYSKKELQKYTPWTCINEFIERIDYKNIKTPVLCIMAATGFGKTTLLPYYLMKLQRKKVKVFVPKVTIAINTALFLGRSPDFPELEVGHNVGYITGERSKPPSADLSITFHTHPLITSMLRDYMQTPDCIVIIDEEQEKTTSSDLCIGLSVAKDILANNAVSQGTCMIFTTASFDFKSMFTYFEIEQNLINKMIFSGRSHEIDIEYLKTKFSDAPKKLNKLLNEKKLKKIIMFAPTIDANSTCLADDFEIIVLNRAALQANPKMLQDMEYENRKFIFASTQVAQAGITIPELDCSVSDAVSPMAIELMIVGGKCLLKVATSPATLIQQAGRVGRVARGTFIQIKYNELQDHLSNVEDEVEYYTELASASAMNPSLDLMYTMMQDFSIVMYQAPIAGLYELVLWYALQWGHCDFTPKELQVLKAVAQYLRCDLKFLMLYFKFLDAGLGIRATCILVGFLNICSSETNHIFKSIMAYEEENKPKYTTDIQYIIHMICKKEFFDYMAPYMSNESNNQLALIHGFELQLIRVMTFLGVPIPNKEVEIAMKVLESTHLVMRNLITELMPQNMAIACGSNAFDVAGTFHVRCPIKADKFIFLMPCLNFVYGKARMQPCVYCKL